jgi:NTP pyrophosphatase (non-canonical NTP hydrolase)
MLIEDECVSQEETWGDTRSMHDGTWLKVLVEEVGEVATALLEGKGLTEELVQVAAVAAAWLEASTNSGYKRGD